MLNIRLRCHIDDHRPLLRHIVPPFAQRAGELDAVLVPAARPAQALRTAADIARRWQAHLVVLASRSCRADQAADVAVHTGVPAERVVSVDIDLAGPAALPRFGVDRVDTGERDRPRDTALKRNLGLRLARLAGWQQVLFLDDDVDGITPVGLDRARCAMAQPGGPAAVAWAFENFPDNSVVCHAHRAAGGDQSTFVGAGGLLVRVDAQVPHFPNVYNEDWLFFAELMQRRERGLGFGGRLRQKQFNPYACSDTARRQEFGDVLGEGLFSLFHARKPLSAAGSSGFWSDYLNIRRRFLDDVHRRLAAGHGALRGSRRQAAIACVEQARQTLASQRGQWELSLPAFVQAWRVDAKAWRRVIARAPEPGLSLHDALAELGLEPAAASGRRVHPVWPVRRFGAVRWVPIGRRVDGAAARAPRTPVATGAGGR